METTLGGGDLYVTILMVVLGGGDLYVNIRCDFVEHW
jgi:hypothetical protein